MNSRRHFLVTLGAGALAAALPARAQSTPPRVCWLSPAAQNASSPFLEEIRQGFRDLGYIEGRNITLVPYWADNSAGKIEQIIAEAIASKPAVLMAQGNIGPTLARMKHTLPVVFGYSGDPVEAGMVDSFARPGRNMTGISYMSLELVGKRLELLKEVLTSFRRIACVNTPSHFGDPSEKRAAQAAAERLGITVEYFEIRPDNPITHVLTSIERARVQAAVFFPTQNIIINAEQIAAWAAKARVPTISGWAQFAQSGNLMSYGPNLKATSRRLAFFTDRILKGTRPGDLPVELPNEVELVINQKMAKAIGVTVPRTVLIRANQVIQ